MPTSSGTIEAVHGRIEPNHELPTGDDITTVSPKTNIKTNKIDNVARRGMAADALDPVARHVVAGDDTLRDNHMRDGVGRIGSAVDLEIILDQLLADTGALAEYLSEHPRTRGELELMAALARKVSHQSPIAVLLRNHGRDLLKRHEPKAVQVQPEPGDMLDDEAEAPHRQRLLADSGKYIVSHSLGFSEHDYDNQDLDPDEPHIGEVEGPRRITTRRRGPVDMLAVYRTRRRV